jgi:hypothetical protein
MVGLSALPYRAARDRTALQPLAGQPPLADLLLRRAGPHPRRLHLQLGGRAALHRGEPAHHPAPRPAGRVAALHQRPGPRLGRALSGQRPAGPRAGRPPPAAAAVLDGALGGRPAPAGPLGRARPPAGRVGAEAGDGVGHPLRGPVPSLQPLEGDLLAAGRVPPGRGHVDPAGHGVDGRRLAGHPAALRQPAARGLGRGGERLRGVGRQRCLRDDGHRPQPAGVRRPVAHGRHPEP